MADALCCDEMLGLNRLSVMSIIRAQMHLMDGHWDVI
jgi:hypothetical protein